MVAEMIVFDSFKKYPVDAFFKRYTSTTSGTVVQQVVLPPHDAMDLGSILSSLTLSTCCHMFPVQFPPTSPKHANNFYSKLPLGMRVSLAPRVSTMSSGHTPPRSGLNACWRRMNETDWYRASNSAQSDD